MKRRVKSIKQTRLEHGIKKLSKMALSKDLFSDDQYYFWLCNGANYLNSDHDKGIWNPIFEQIYGESGTVPPMDEIMTTAVNAFGDQSTWTPQSKAATAWLTMDRRQVFIYYMEAVRRMMQEEKSESDLVQPANPVVWGVFSFLYKMLVKQKVI
jgi:hypothetical protein